MEELFLLAGVTRKEAYAAQTPSHFPTTCPWKEEKSHHKNCWLLQQLALKEERKTCKNVGYFNGIETALHSASIHPGSENQILGNQQTLVLRASPCHNCWLPKTLDSD
eukprot:1840287-Amphidinium_carterae.1